MNYLAAYFCSFCIALGNWNHFATASDPVDQLEGLASEYSRAVEAWKEAYSGESTEKSAVSRYREWPGWEFAPKFLAIGESEGPSEAGFDALCKIIEMGSGVGEFDQEIYTSYERAIEILLERHQDRPLSRLIPLVGTSPKSEALLQFLSDFGDNARVHAEAKLDLGRLYAMRREMGLLNAGSVLASGGPFSRYKFERAVWKDDPEPTDLQLRDLFDKARRCFKEVIASHNSLKTTESGKTFGSLARRDLHELSFLSVGQQASEIIGVDLEGNQMKISDHRGEIVLIVFWASWCGPCMADVPHEKALLEKFAGRRFIIVGVNGDDDLVQAVKAKTEHEIPFRSFRKVAPGISETLTDSWNVKAWPTTYILDSHGIIRYKQLRREQLDGPIEFLLTELEGKGGK